MYEENDVGSIKEMIDVAREENSRKIQKIQMNLRNCSMMSKNHYMKDAKKFTKLYNLKVR